MSKQYRITIKLRSQDSEIHHFFTTEMQAHHFLTHDMPTNYVRRISSITLTHIQELFVLKDIRSKGDLVQKVEAELHRRTLLPPE